MIKEPGIPARVWRKLRATTLGEWIEKAGDAFFNIGTSMAIFLALGTTLTWGSVALLVGTGIVLAFVAGFIQALEKHSATDKNDTRTL